MARNFHVSIFAISIAALSLLSACTGDKKPATTGEASGGNPYSALVERYARVPLRADVSHLTDNQKQMVRMFLEASHIMDDLFWHEAYGRRDSLLEALDDEYAREYVKINYGPWDRLNNNEPFIPGVATKPPGANFYPVDMTREEFESAVLDDKQSQYTMIRRDASGVLVAIPYHEYFADRIDEAARLIGEAAELAEDPGFAKYLRLRAQALQTDEYLESDMAWMDMKENTIDLVIGPIENYEDKLYNYKSAHEAYILLKDMDWSERLTKFAAFLPELQEGLPVPDQYKQEKPGTNADLNAYDVLYYAGDCNAGSKTIAINLPNDERVQLAKGSRRLQLKNAMRAKFDQILVPISEVLIDEEQRGHITFDAFFSNTMFHEVAHGLGIKNTISGRGTVRESLKEHSSALEEGKADILGLYMITQLHRKGEIDRDIVDYYTTFMAGIFRSVRFGTASAHGLANMIRFNFFKEMGAFQRNDDTGTYRVNYDKMQEAADALSHLILTIQGDGDYEAAARLIAEKAVIDPQLQRDLQRLEQAEIPVDIVFEQGGEILGL